MSTLSTSTRYFLPGVTQIIVCPAVSSLAVGPTRLELTGGTNVSGEIAGISGWNITSETQPTPDLARRFVKQVTGRLTASDSSLTFWADKAGIDVRALLTRDLETHVAFLDGGDVEDSLMDVFKVTVASVGKVREIEGVGRLEVKFTIRDYAEDLAIPAAV